MLSWISNAAQSVASWVGSGAAALIEWLLAGLNTVATKIIDAADSLFDLLESIWGFGVNVLDTVVTLVQRFFPWVPLSVLSAISLGLTAVFIIGIVKKIRKG